MIKGTVFEYIDKLVINCGFFFEGQTKEELPERMLFKVSYNKSDPNKIIKYIIIERKDARTCFSPDCYLDLKSL